MTISCKISPKLSKLANDIDKNSLLMIYFIDSFKNKINLK